MKSKLTIVAIIICQSLLIIGQREHSIRFTNIKVKSPFNVPAIIILDFSKCQKLPITDFGAVLGNKEKTTEAIAKVIHGQLVTSNN